MKKLIVFDLDGTLAVSKAALDTEMSTLFKQLLDIVKVAIISGGDWPQFEKQVISNLPSLSKIENLSLLPTCGTKYYVHNGTRWEKIYSEDFTPIEKNKIITSLEKAVENAGFKTTKIWGNQIEDRGSQITFSALGQEAPIEAKKTWDITLEKRKKIQLILNRLIPEFSATIGGTTSVDITKHGIDKAYGMKKLEINLKISIDQMLFIGDALFNGGNDYPARTTGATCIQVRDPEETKRIIEAIIACMAK